MEASGDTPMVPFVTKRIVRFAFLYFITSDRGCQGADANILQVICWRVQNEPGIPRKTREMGRNDRENHQAVRENAGFVYFCPWMKKLRRAFALRSDG